MTRSAGIAKAACRARFPMRRSNFGRRDRSHFAMVSTLKATYIKGMDKARPIDTRCDVRIGYGVLGLVD